MTLPEPYVDPATIPELQTILGRGLLSKVRIFEAWCENENGDRLFQVLRIGGRPLALARSRRDSVTLSPNPELHGQRHLGHRERWLAMWLDLDWRAYYLPHSLAAWDDLRESSVLHSEMAAPIGGLRCLAPSACRHKQPHGCRDNVCVLLELVSVVVL